MMTQKINFVASITLTLGLLLIAAPAYSCPIQDTITLRAIGVGPVQPQPVRDVTPAPQQGPIIGNPGAAIGVTPTAIGVGPAAVPQPQPQPQPIGPVVVPGDYVPDQEYYPAPQPNLVPQGIPHPHGPVVLHPGGPQPVRAVVGSGDFNEKRALAGLQDLINQQATLGQFPHNNRVLSDLSAVIAKYQHTPASKVRVVNSGSGTLRVTHANGSITDVRPNFSLEIDVKSAKVHLSAQSQDTLISLTNIAGSPVNFWDQDDNRHHPLRSDQFGVSQPRHFTLTPGVWGHHLTQ